MNGELRNLILQGHEAPDLDHKGPMAWDESDKGACCEIVKDVMALANSGGGWLVIGVSETNTGFVPVGLTPEQAGSYDATRMGNWVRKYSDPPVVLNVHKVEHAGAVYVLLGVSAFGRVPHVCVKPFPDVLQAPCIYVRTEACESAPVSNAGDLNALVERAVRNRKDEMLAAPSAVIRGHENRGADGDDTLYLAQAHEAEARYKELAGADGQRAAHLIVIAGPERFDACRFSHDTLLANMRRSDERLTGWPFFFLGQPAKDHYTIEDGVESDVASNFIGSRHYFYQVRYSGQVYHAESLWEDHEPRFRGRKVIDYAHVPIHIALAVRALCRLYEDVVAPDEVVKLSLLMEDTDGREVDSIEPLRFIDEGHIARVATLKVSDSRTLADWSAEMVEHVVALSKQVFRLFNFPDASEEVLRDIAERTYSRRLQ